MSSLSLIKWEGERSETLDEIEAAHAKVGGTSRGRRYATQQLNLAYTVLLSSQFQGFCRDLHSEAVDHIVAHLAKSPQVALMLREQFTRGRMIDRGNPNPGNLGSDFNRLGFAFWNEVKAQGRHNATRHTGLGNMNEWRNAIAHHDFATLGTATLHLKTVRAWRGYCNGLATSFDAVVADQLAALLGAAPW
jgi:hypothetical protein